MTNYRANYYEKMMLTMASETAYVHVGQSSYGNTRGAYLPIIDALRDSIDILRVQLYNSGDMYGIDGGVYSQRTSDFIVAMTEAVIEGFNTQGEFFNGFPANKIAIGLPACSSAAGGGFTSTTEVKDAIDYLMGVGNKPGLYTLQNSLAHASLLGMMTWSINWGALITCSNSYGYAQNFQDIFLNFQASIDEDVLSDLKAYPNPVTDKIKLTASSYIGNGKLDVISMTGELILSQEVNLNNEVEVDISHLKNGVYLFRISTSAQTKIFRISKR
jgi:hypothetical protein